MASNNEPALLAFVQSVPREELAERLSAHLQASAALLASLPEEKSGYAYAPGKWSVRRLVGHLCISQRVFVTRAVRISRGETQALTGYDENAYAEDWPGEEVSLATLAGVYAAEAASTLAWFRLLRPEELEREGTANGTRRRPQEILRALIGHESHHLRMLAERYGLGTAPGRNTGNTDT